MTTNQTIDGVSRELLEKALRDASMVRFPTDNHVTELRALLDAPEVLVVPLSGPKEWLDSLKPAAQPQGEPVACAHEWTDDGEFTLTCTKCGKTENHEPYGWVQTRGNAINHFTQEWDVVESWEDQGFEYKAMFDHAEQPAPVAVLPERLQQVLKFLDGAENLDGHWFGEPHPSGRPYWWRNELRKALAETNLFAKQQ